ncbi:hypothetical protein FK529_00275 [Tsukamurella asaccharolytica]|uniref:SecDF P1 head subdomain domain-containing protein n=1 Tax=Tsukamurella asaccharolytica TaxID=2592067 RepID=A0A5C5RFC9_9ACTN|nr:hypothetical protein [Tsukamurella asaccharolytica]TWS21093.1 hypothetical protein FK529_00275 [Tsukamurella asaccharolytica]
MGRRSVRVLGVAAMIAAATATTAYQGVAHGEPVTAPQVPQVRLVTSAVPTTPEQCQKGGPAATEPARICDTAGRFLYAVAPSVTRTPVKRASAFLPQNQNRWAVTLELADPDAKAVADLTARNVGKRIAIVIGGRVVSAPTVADRITGGRLLVTGDFDEKSAKDLAHRLQPS